MYQDEGLRPLRTNEIAATLTNIASIDRQRYGQVLLQLLHQPIELIIKDIHQVVSSLMIVSDDKDSLVRASLVDQIPHVFGRCHEIDSAELDYYLYDRLLDIVLAYLKDVEPQVRKIAYSSLLQLLDKYFVDKTRLEEKVCPAIVELSNVVPDFDQQNIDLQTNPVGLMARIAPLVGQKKTSEFFLDRFLALCQADVHYVRRVCATNFPTICQVMGPDITETQLLPMFIRLCEDGTWAIRKACADALPMVTLMCSVQYRRDHLAPIVSKLINDPCRWVSMAAFEILGQFISSFAKPCITGLAYTSEGELFVTNPADDTYRDHSEQNLLINLDHYETMFATMMDCPLPVNSEPNKCLQSSLSMTTPPYRDRTVELASVTCGTDDFGIGGGSHSDLFDDRNRLRYSRAPMRNTRNNLAIIDGTSSFSSNIMREYLEEMDMDSKNGGSNDGDGGGGSVFSDTTGNGSKSKTNKSVIAKPLEENTSVSSTMETTYSRLGNKNDENIDNDNNQDNNDNDNNINININTVHNKNINKDDENKRHNDSIDDDDDADADADDDDDDDDGNNDGANNDGNDEETKVDAEFIDKVYNILMSGNITDIEALEHASVVAQPNNNPCTQNRTMEHLKRNAPDDLPSIIKLAFDNIAQDDRSSSSSSFMTSTQQSQSQAQAQPPQPPPPPATPETPSIENAPQSVHFPVLLRGRPRNPNNNNVTNEYKSITLQEAIESMNRTADINSNMNLDDDHELQEMDLEKSESERQQEDQSKEMADNDGDDNNEEMVDNNSYLHTNRNEVSTTTATTDDGVTDEDDEQQQHQAGASVTAATASLATIAADTQSSKPHWNSRKNKRLTLGLCKSRTLLSKPLSFRDVDNMWGPDDFKQDDDDNMQKNDDDEDDNKFNSHQFWYIKPDLPLDDALVAAGRPETSNYFVAYESFANGSCIPNRCSSSIDIGGGGSGSGGSGGSSSGGGNNGYDDMSKEKSIANSKVSIDVSQYKQDLVPLDLVEYYLTMVNYPRTEMTYFCAYNLPAVVLTLGRENWHLLYNLLPALCGDLQWKVRKTVAASIYKIALIIGRALATRDLVPIFLGFFKDLDEVKIEAIRNLHNFLKVIDQSAHAKVIESLHECYAMDNSTNWRFREDLAKQVLVLIHMYNEMDHKVSLQKLTLMIFRLLLDNVHSVRQIAFDAMVARVKHCPKREVNTLIGMLVRHFVKSDHWRIRQTFAVLCHKWIAADAIDPVIFERKILSHLMTLARDPVPNVRLVIAKCLATGVMEHPYFADKSHSQYEHLVELIVDLQKDKDRDVRELAACRLVPSSVPTVSTNTANVTDPNDEEGDNEHEDEEGDDGEEGEGMDQVSGNDGKNLFSSSLRGGDVENRGLSEQQQNLVSSVMAAAAAASKIPKRNDGGEKQEQDQDHQHDEDDEDDDDVYDWSVDPGSK